MPIIYIVAKTLSASRAVVRNIEPGSSDSCAWCQGPIRFSARNRQDQVIANVYVGDSWDRVEHYHAACYEEAGRPYGAARS